MRFAAQKTIGMQDMLPADGSIYQTDMVDKGSSMMRALRAWEKKRGLNLSFKGKLMCKKAVVEPVAPEPAPVERKKPGPKPTLTEEQKRQIKKEYNAKKRAAEPGRNAAQSRAYRAALTPEKKEMFAQKNRAYKAAKRAEKLRAGNVAGSGRNTGLPLADAAVSREEGTA